MFGMKQVATHRCVKCRRRLSELQATCEHCGWTVDAALARATAQRYARKRLARSLKKYMFSSKNRNVFINLILLVIILLLFFGFIYIIISAMLILR